MTDLKKLRELAEAVLNTKPDFCGGNWRTHYDYEKAANPQAILALIDELESVKAQLAQAEAVIMDYDSGPKNPGSNRARQYLEKWKVGK